MQAAAQFQYSVLLAFVMPPISFTHSMVFYVVAHHRAAELKAWFAQLPLQDEELDEESEEERPILLRRAARRIGQLAIATVVHNLTMPITGRETGMEYYVEKYNLADPNLRYNPTEYIDYLCGGTTLQEYPFIVVTEYDARERIRLKQLMRDLIAQRMILEEHEGMVIAHAAIKAMPDRAILVSWFEQGS